MRQKFRGFRRSVALITVFAVLVGLFPAVIFANDSNSFTDTTEHWASKEIQRAVEEGLFNGISESKFDPQGSMTRAMFITVLHRLSDKLEGPKVKQDNHTFTDVTANAWYASAISWAVNAGLTEGYGNGIFGPNDVLNREQITVLLIRFLETHMGYDLGDVSTNIVFSDDAQISSWAKEAVYKAVALGLIQGETATTFNAKGAASRAVVAVISGRFLDTAKKLEEDRKEANKQEPTPSPSPSPTPTTTPEYSGGSGGGSGGGSQLIAIKSAEILKNDATVTSAVYVRTGDKLSIKVAPANAKVDVEWYLNDVLRATGSTYDVQALDVGGVFTASVKGNEANKYTGTITTDATGEVIATVALDESDLDRAPVILGSGVKYKDVDGNEIDITAADSVAFSVKTNSEPVPDEEKADVQARVLQEITDPSFDIEDIKLNYLSLDAELLVEQQDQPPTVVHPVGKVILNLSKASLGFNTDEDISQHVFVIGHTNIDGVHENVVGEVVTIIGEQYVRIELNGLSRIYIGNIPPLTVSFDTTGGSPIASKKVKLGEVTPQVEYPTREGYFFLGWDADLTTTLIFKDFTFRALWLEGSYVPQNRVSLVNSNDEVVENSNIDNTGTIRLRLSDDTVYDPNTIYTLAVTDLPNATKYVYSDDAEAAAAEVYSNAQSTNGEVTFDIAITDNDGKVEVGKHEYFIKWFNADEDAIILEAVTVIVETDTKSATREKTFNINRGIGKVEALLKAKDRSDDDYYAYHNGYLSGSASADNYSLYINSSFDQNIYNAKPSIEIDYSKYDIFNVIFTPFTGESYSSKSVSATAYYYDETNTRQTLNLNTSINDEGKLVIANSTSQVISSLSTRSNNVYIYITVTVDGVSQRVDLNIFNLFRTPSTSRDFVNATSWTEVLNLLQTRNNIYISYTGNENIIIDSKLVLNPTQQLYIANEKDLTIASGGELKLEATNAGNAHLRVNGNLTVQSGGKLTRNAELPSQQTYHSTSLYVDGKITIEAGSDVNVPEHGILYLSGVNGGIEIATGAVVTINGELNFQSDLILNGEIKAIGANSPNSSSFRGSLYTYYDVTVNGKITVTDNGYVYNNGLLTIAEGGEIEFVKGSGNLNSKVYNNGKLTVKEGHVTFSNVDFAVNNNGTIDLSTSATINFNGTTLVNMGEVKGTGTIHLVETANASSNYDNGIDFVDVSQPHSTINYPRYQFVKDPEKTVVATIYESKISGSGSVQSTIRENKVVIQD